MKVFLVLGYLISSSLFAQELPSCLDSGKILTKEGSSIVRLGAEESASIFAAAKEAQIASDPASNYYRQFEHDDLNMVLDIDFIHNDSMVCCKVLKRFISQNQLSVPIENSEQCAISVKTDGHLDNLKFIFLK